MCVYIACVEVSAKSSTDRTTVQSPGYRGRSVTPAHLGRDFVILVKVDSGGHCGKHLVFLFGGRRRDVELSLALPCELESQREGGGGGRETVHGQTELAKHSFSVTLTILLARVISITSSERLTTEPSPSPLPLSTIFTVSTCK